MLLMGDKGFRVRVPVPPNLCGRFPQEGDLHHRPVSLLLWSERQVSSLRPLVPNQVRFQLRHAPRGVDEWQTLKDSNLGMLGSKPSAVDRLAKRLHLVAEGGFEPTDLWLMRPEGTTGLPYSAILSDD